MPSGYIMSANRFLPAPSRTAGAEQTCPKRPGLWAAGAGADEFAAPVAGGGGGGAVRAGTEAAEVEADRCCCLGAAAGRGGAGRAAGRAPPRWRGIAIAVAVEEVDWSVAVVR